MTPDEPDVPIDDLVEQLRNRVADRRLAGEYPADLEAQLDSHFSRITGQRESPFDPGELRQRLSRLQGTLTFARREVGTTSKVPGGALFHRAVARLVRRHVDPVVAHAQEQANALSAFAEELVQAIEHPQLHEHPGLVSQLDLVFERLRSFRRATTGAPALGAVMDRVSELEAARSQQQFSPWFSNERFEAAFRGNADELRDRYRDLARQFVDLEGLVVDIGCGRGEFLQLLLDLGVDARGIEIDPALVALNHQSDLPVEYGSLVPWLEGQDDSTVDGLALIQVVEHISAQDLVEFVRLAAHKVKPGGRVVVETVNPQSLYVYAHSFYLDPTHLSPIHPAYLVFLFQEIGFSRVEIDWRSPCPEDDTLVPLEGGSAETERLNDNIERLNRLLFAPQDYALIATR